MWPTTVDFTKNECRGLLRHLELDAYSSVISTFRAQGSLDNGKSNLLEQLRKVFHITQDRHKAEARRVANDEKLKTIAELLNGKNFDLEWTREGHRTYPLIARTPPSTALKYVADQASIETTNENSLLPHPNETKRSKTLDEDAANAKPIVLKDPTLPPPSHPIGLTKKEMKRSQQSFLDTAVSSSKKRGNLLQQYKHVLPTPNMKIRQLYNSFQGKKQRKAHKKQSKKSAKYGMQSPPAQLVPMPGTSKNSAAAMNPRMIHSYASSVMDEKLFEGAELQKHLTAQQVMLPPPIPTNQVNAGSNNFFKPSGVPYIPVLPTSKKDVASNLIKMNSQHYSPMEPNFVSNSMGSPKQQKMGKKMSMYSMEAPETQILHNTLKSPKNTKVAQRTNNFDHIPDPKIIFNTTSSKPVSNDPNIITNNIRNSVKIPGEMVDSLQLDLNDAASATSPLQLLSATASSIPKIKITPQMQVQNPKPIQNKSNIKILPSTSITQGGKVIFKQIDGNLKKTTSNISGTGLPKLSMTPNKMQKIQLVVSNKNLVLDPSTNNKPVIISGKPANNSQNNIYTIGGKSGLSIVTSDNAKQKVIVQNVEQKYVPLSSGDTNSVNSNNSGNVENNEKIVVVNQYNIIDNQIVGGASSVVPRTPDQDFQNSPVITEDTPIDILSSIPTISTQQPQQTQTQPSYPKVQLSGNFLKTVAGSKQIKLLPLSGTGIVQPIKIAGINISKIGNRFQIPKNFINAKSVTILPQQSHQQQPQQQPQQQQQQQQQPTTQNETKVSVIVPKVDGADKNSENPIDHPSTDWEQELDDVNRVKNVKPTGKGGVKINHPGGPNLNKSVKKLRLTTHGGEIVGIADNSTTSTNCTNNLELQSEKNETSETNNNVYDTSNLVIYDNSMNTNENIIIESVENIIPGPESLTVEDDEQRVVDGDPQIIIVNPEDHQQLIDEENGKQSSDESLQKVNGQFVEVGGDGEVLNSQSFTYQELVKSINEDDEYDEIPRISSEEQQEKQEDVTIPITNANSFDEFVASTKLLTNDIVGSDGDEFSESTSSSTINTPIAQQKQEATPKIQSIE